jgi:ribosome biogenesis GTPase
MNNQPNNDQTDDGIREGTVYRKSQGHYTVHDDGQVVDCAMSSKLRKEIEQWMGASASTNVHRKTKAVREIHQVDPVAVGDRVRYLPGERGSEGLIVEVLPRRNHLSRLSPGPRPDEQVIVANVDQVVPVMSIRQPAAQWTLLDRYLAAAESAGIPSAICLTKVDLAPGDPELRDMAAIYRRLGYPVLLTSAVTSEGIADLAAALQGRVSALVGKSGVGKTTLLNAVQPGLGLRVSAVSQATGKGRHTTSHLEMFPLDPNGIQGAVIDTPGIREFGLWDDEIEGGLAGLFVEMRPYLGACRFGLDCTHSHEPGCAVKRAVQAGKIAPQRYDSYLRLLE